MPVAAMAMEGTTEGPKVLGLLGLCSPHPLIIPLRPYPYGLHTWYETLTGTYHLELKILRVWPAHE